MDRICNLSTLFLFVNLIPHSPIICAYLNSLEYYSSFYFQSHYVKHNKLITHITHSQEEYIKEIFAVMITYASVFWTLYSNMFIVILAKNVWKFHFSSKCEEILIQSICGCGKLKYICLRKSQIAQHVVEMIFVIVDLPSRKTNDKDCWIFFVVKKRNVNAGFSSGDIAFCTRVSFFEIFPSTNESR